MVKFCSVSLTSLTASFFLQQHVPAHAFDASKTPTTVQRLMRPYESEDIPTRNANNDLVVVDEDDDDDGFNCGSVEGIAEDDISEILVEFQYEIETLQNINASETVSNLDATIAELIANELGMNCAVNENRNLKRRKLMLSKLSSKEADTIIDTSCINEVEAGTNNDCNVVDGSLTFYTSDGTDYTSQILTNIKKEMNDADGPLYSEEGIVKLSFLESEIKTDTPIESNKTEKPETPDFDRADGGYATAIIASAGALVFVFAGFFAGRRYLNKNEDDEEDAMDLEEAENQLDFSNELNESGIMVNNDSILNSSGSVTASSFTN